jgi:2-polyprenyl-3-methyl-5-hydroxy-6-metoxy-1,4-benzoquinol methylase
MPIPNLCPLCKSDSKCQSVVTPHVYGDVTKSHAFFRCKSCDVIYQYPFLTPEEESKFYNKEFEAYMNGRSGKQGGWLDPESHILANGSTVQRRLKYLIPHIKSNSKVLEVGCSSGFMLFPLREMGHTCYGIEPSGIFSEFLRERKIPVYSNLNELEQSNESLDFDIIQHFFVLEHISDPINFLSEQMKLLKPGGKLIFEVPNSADALFTIYDVPAFERFFWSIAHPYYFSEKSLRFVLDSLGFSYEIHLQQRYDLSNHFTWALEGKPGGMNKYSHKFGQNIEDAYKDALVSSGNCDTLIGVIIKSC